MCVAKDEAESTFSQLPEVLRIETNSRQCLFHLLLIGTRIQIPQCGVTRGPLLLLLLLQLPLLLLLLLLLLRLLSLLLQLLLLLLELRLLLLQLLIMQL